MPGSGTGSERAGEYTGPCTVTVSSPANGGVFDTSGGNSNEATMALNGQSLCSGTVTWSFQWSYMTGNGNTYNASDSTQTTTGQQSNFSPTVGNGGNASVTVSVNNGTPTTWTVYVDGVLISSANITGQLVALYSNGARTHLLMGIAEVESSYRPFTLRSKYAINGYWPTESYDGGSHVGLMQVPMSMANAFDWTANMRAGSSLFSTKRQASYNYNASEVNANPHLPDLTDIQVENDALVFYGPYGSLGHY